MRTPLTTLLLTVLLAVACNDSAAPPPPVGLSLQRAPTNSGDGQTDTLGGTLANPLRVLVLRGQAPVRGIVVSWAVFTGSVSPNSTTTDASGIAQATWTLGDTVGEQIVTAFLPTDSLAVSFTAIALPGAPRTLGFRPGPSNSFADRPFIPFVRVAALDRRANVATDFRGRVTVALGSAPGRGSLSGTTMADAVDGIATFIDLSLDLAGAGYTLIASASGLLGVTSAAFEIVLPGPGRIAFWSDRDGNAEIYTINADGTGAVRLTDSTATDLGPAWSPDGTRIAFSRDAQISVMNADGSGSTVLTDGSDPAWSLDGTKIAGSKLFAALCPRPFGRPCRVNRIFVMNSDGSGIAVLRNGTTPAWSLEGKIAFVDLSEIFIVSPDGSGLTQLTDDPASADGPAWSPDGTRIAFRSTRSGAPDIYVMNANGTGITALTHDPAVEGRPAWSPDGSRIAFASTRDGDYEIYIMRADGSGVTQITDNTANDARPAWSP